MREFERKRLHGRQDENSRCFDSGETVTENPILVTSKGKRIFSLLAFLTDKLMDL